MIMTKRKGRENREGAVGKSDPGIEAQIAIYPVRATTDRALV